MAEPKTLLQMAGASSAPPPLSESTVVVIDAQREYTDGKLPLTDVQPALDEIGKLLRRARALQVPVIHIVHQGKPGGAFGPDTPGFEVASPATPAPGEAVVHKSLPNAFASTDLASRLAALKKPNVLLVGFMTHMCVEATARASIDLGFKATVGQTAVDRWTQRYPKRARYGLSPPGQADPPPSTDSRATYQFHAIFW